MKEFKKLFSNYKFGALLISQILSQLTINILSFLILIKLFEQTGSSIATSLVWVAYAMPAIIVGPIAAGLVDFVDKKYVLMATNLLQAITIFIYAILLYKNLVFLPYAIVFIYSFLNQFYVPAEAASLPTIVSEKFLPQANSIFFITQQSSLVIGFGLAGILETIFGFRSTILGMSVLLLTAFVSTSFLPNRKSSNKLSRKVEDKVSEFFSEIAEGYRFITQTKKIFLPFVLLLGLQVIIAVIVTNLPRIGIDILMVSANAAGVFVMVPAGAGAVIGTFLISKVLNQKFKKGRLIFTCMFVFTLVIALATLVLPLISFHIVRIVVGVILFFVVGLSVVGVLIPSITFLQENTPEKLLGRVFGNFWFLTTIVTVLPVLFSATISDLLGIRTLLLFISLISLVTIIAYRKEAVRL